MDATPDQVETFAAEVRRRRESFGWSTTELAKRVAAICGMRVQRQDIENWEDRHAPRKREKVLALDQALADRVGASRAIRRSVPCSPRAERSGA